MYTELEDKKQSMVEENMGLVHACAHKFKGRGIEYDDLFQAGCIGLIKAAKAFDFERGVRFSTYAVPVILGEMKRLFRDGGSVKVSRSLKELSLKVNRVREQYQKKYGTEPTVNEIAQAVGISSDEVVEAISALTPPLSLTESEDEKGGQIDIPVDSPENLLADILSLKQTIAALEEKDRKLILLRYFNNKTQTQTAQLLGMTQVQVSRREKKILIAMRQKLTG